MDFGIARSLAGAGMTAEGIPDRDAGLHVSRAGGGERGGPEVGPLFALGVILFEMATGRPPFEGDTPLSVAFKHKNEIPIAPRKLNSQVPEPLNKVILRCLEKDKANRYQTAEELLCGPRLSRGRASDHGAGDDEDADDAPALGPQARGAGGALSSQPSRRSGLSPPLSSFGVVLPRGKAPAPASSSGKPSIAILNFENLTGDPGLDYLESGPGQTAEPGIYRFQAHPGIG